MPMFCQGYAALGARCIFSETNLGGPARIQTAGERCKWCSPDNVASWFEPTTRARRLLGRARSQFRVFDYETQQLLMLFYIPEVRRHHFVGLLQIFHQPPQEPENDPAQDHHEVIIISDDEPEAPEYIPFEAQQVPVVLPNGGIAPAYVPLHLHHLY